MSRSNIFEAGAVEVTDLFADYLEGSPTAGSCLALAFSEKPLGTAERAAIQKSLAALGFGEDACTYATALPRGGEAEAGDIPLDAQATFLLVEGLDPLRIIACDRRSTELLARAYRTTFAPDSAVRIFGRPSTAFADLASLLATDAGKQKAWALFKTLR